MSVENYNYLLPEEKIAFFPTENRSNSKLLFYDGKEIKNLLFNDIVNILPENSILIRNNTKVVKARMFLNRYNDKSFEVFCLNKYNNDDNYEIIYECLIKNVKKLKENEVLTSSKIIDNKELELQAKFVGRIDANSLVHFSWNDKNYNFDDILEIFGQTALPPYIKRDVNENDAERYQTVYASKAGSVAAPTAGLHFTNEIEEKLEQKGIQTKNVLLHVGLGTFQPMKTDNLKDHQMHSEVFEVSIDTIEALYTCEHNNIVAVGTTSLRTLESLYVLAHKINNSNEKSNHFIIEQWEAEQLEDKLKPQQAWKNILEWMKENNYDFISGSTSLIITNQHICHSIDYLVTNFHQPKSTLLLIVASILGEKWKSLYEYALENNYRFLSYGDSCLFKNTRK